MRNQDLQDFQDEQDFDESSCLTNFRIIVYTKIRQNPVHPENPANPDSTLTIVRQNCLEHN